MAVALATQTSSPVQAANINVNASCDLASAIIAANTDSSFNGCPTGNGADTINLVSNSTVSFTSAHPYGSYAGGYSALPFVNSTITIQGNNSTLLRDEAVDDIFRLIEVRTSGNLTLNDLTLENGNATTAGGAINCANAELNLSNSTVSNNQVIARGGGIFANGCAVTISNSVVSDNIAYSQQYGIGGGIHHVYGSLTIDESSIVNNFAGAVGGAMFISNTSSVSVNQSQICLLYTSPSPRDLSTSRMPSSA